jgi:hypothetical protein
MSSQLHRLWWVKVLSAAALLAPPAMVFASAQEPASPPAAAPASNSSASAAKPGHKKYSHANDFLIRGTVFNEKSLSFPRVELRIRVTGAKKYRWDSYTNSRGEFAVRVPQGASYEIAVRAKGFEEQTRTVDAKNGGNEETVVFRMQPIAGGKK